MNTNNKILMENEIVNYFKRNQYETKYNKSNIEIKKVSKYLADECDKYFDERNLYKYVWILCSVELQTIMDNSYINVSFKNLNDDNLTLRLGRHNYIRTIEQPNYNREIEQFDKEINSDIVNKKHNQLKQKKDDKYNENDKNKKFLNILKNKWQAFMNYLVNILTEED